MHFKYNLVESSSQASFIYSFYIENALEFQTFVLTPGEGIFENNYGKFVVFAAVYWNLFHCEFLHIFNIRCQTCAVAGFCPRWDISNSSHARIEMFLLVSSENVVSLSRCFRKAYYTFIQNLTVSWSNWFIWRSILQF